MTLFCEDCGDVIGATDAQIVDLIYCEDCASNHNLVIEVVEEDEEVDEVDEEEKEEEKP